MSTPENPYITPPQPVTPENERLGSTLTHLSWIAIGLISGSTLSAFGFVVPLVVLLTLGKRGPFIRAHAIAALNLQISIVIYSLVIVVVGFLTLGFGFVLFIPLAIVAIIFSILAAVAANRGEYYTYPLTIAFVK